MLALPPRLSPPDDVHRISAAMFTISYTCAVVTPVISGVAVGFDGNSGAGLHSDRFLRRFAHRACANHGNTAPLACYPARIEGLPFRWLPFDLRRMIALLVTAHFFHREWTINVNEASSYHHDITAEAFLSRLAERGIEYVFANAGTDFAPIIEALSRNAATQIPALHHRAA